MENFDANIYENKKYLKKQYTLNTPILITISPDLFSNLNSLSIIEFLN